MTKFPRSAGIFTKHPICCRNGKGVGFSKRSIGGAALGRPNKRRSKTSSLSRWWTRSGRPFGGVSEGFECVEIVGVLASRRTVAGVLTQSRQSAPMVTPDNSVSCLVFLPRCEQARAVRLTKESGMNELAGARVSPHPIYCEVLAPGGKERR